jgi:Domain of unknown function (DUF4335)
MNSPNLQPRQFVHNTCELSIDDKKSPFPAWMKFNKPNPLRFSLTVNDPDRPELEPMRVEGDRTKLESLHRTTEEYVKNLVARAPLPQMNGEEPGKLPQSAAFDDTINSSDLQHRPIDALKVSDEKPRIEADGISRHLFYLGSGADANTTTMSLSTLQLFDLSSALNEGMTPVIEPEVEPEKPVALAAAAETLVQPVVLPPEAVTNNNKSSATTSLKSGQSNVEEPRVVLPSANAAESSDTSEDLYGLETESSILERSNSSKDRFKMPKPSLGSLNLPELPDFSRSPLTSIPLWLGLGGMAAVILTSPLWMNMFKGGDSVAKKPATPITQVATAPTDSPAPYQPSDPTIASGAGIPSANIPNTTNLGGLGTTGNPNPPGIIPGTLGQSTLGQGTVGQNPNTVQNRTAPSQTGKTNTSTGNSTGINPGSLDPFKNRAGQQTGSNNQPGGNSAAAKALQDRFVENAKKPKKGADGANQSSPSRVLVQNNGGDISDSYNPLLKPITGEESTTKRSRNQSRQKPLIENPEPIEAPTIIGQGSNLGSGGSGLFNTPISIPQVENPKNLEAPIISSDSVQAKGLQGYFQKIWRADPKFSSSLQYKVNVGRNGRVISLEGIDQESKFYLDKTNFLKPGIAVSASGQKDQKIVLVLHSTGDVQTFSDEE